MATSGDFSTSVRVGLRQRGGSSARASHLARPPPPAWTHFGPGVAATSLGLQEVCDSDLPALPSRGTCGGPGCGSRAESGGCREAVGTATHLRAGAGRPGP